MCDKCENTFFAGDPIHPSMENPDRVLLIIHCPEDGRRVITRPMHGVDMLTILSYVEQSLEFGQLRGLLSSA